MGTVAQVSFSDYATSVAQALDAIGAADRLPQDGLIILKPNLTNADPPPVTTPVGIVEAVLQYCRKCTDAEIAVGEGCGSGVTADAYEANGYVEMAARHGIRLLDFIGSSTCRWLTGCWEESRIEVWRGERGTFS